MNASNSTFTSSCAGYISEVGQRIYNSALFVGSAINNGIIQPVNTILNLPNQIADNVFGSLGWSDFDTAGERFATTQSTPIPGDDIVFGALGAISRINNVGKIISINRVDDVISETLNSTRKNTTSNYILTADEALEAGVKFVGPGYKEIGKPGSGVFRSADETRQFRMDNGSLSGSHPPNKPHVHLETYKPGANKHIVNNHIPYVD